MSSHEATILEILNTLKPPQNGYSYPSLGYPGGKKIVSKKIISEMPPHKTYVEPFAGAAHVFFNKPKAEKNVLNDINKELIAFFKDVKGKNICCNVKDSRTEFDRIRNKKNKSVCDYISLNKISYGGKNVFDGKPSYANRKKKRNDTVCISGEKLNRVILSSRDFRDIIKKYDSKDTLFYADPPYVEANKKECLYGKGRCEVTPNEIADTIKNIKGKVILSYDDHPDVRKAFRNYKIKKIELPYSFARKDGKVKGNTKELLIKNF